jgi:hypothetical protein
VESAADRGFELHADEFILTTGNLWTFGCEPDFGSRIVLEAGTSAMRDIGNGSVFVPKLSQTECSSCNFDEKTKEKGGGGGGN